SNEVVATDDPPETSASPAHPFKADAPEAFELVAVGPGSWSQAWGDDVMGNNSPFTVLTDGTREVIVSTAGIGAAGGPQSAFTEFHPDIEKLKVDSRPAVFGLPWESATGGSTPAEISIDLGDGVAIGLRGPDMTRQDLVALARHVDAPVDHALAPIVDGLPQPWTIVGSVDADVFGAITSHFRPSATEGPGPTSGLGMGWTSSTSQISVVILRGDAADMDALLQPMDLGDGESSLGRKVTVGSRPGVLFAISTRTATGISASPRVSVVVHDDSGSLVFVTVSDSTVVPEAEIFAIAESVRAVDQGTWDAGVEQLKVKIAGGPGLHPDPGSTQIARGKEGDLEWLLQTAPSDQVSDNGPELVGYCLKLSDYTRACAGQPTTKSRGGRTVPSAERDVNWNDSVDANIYVALKDSLPKGFRPFIIGELSAPEKGPLDGFSLRARTESTEASTTLVPIPGTKSYAAIMFVDAVGTPVCVDAKPPPDSNIHPVTVELLSPTGSTLACFGI
ncbi:MAG TPA: hypothetical protein VL068_07215, partial [Microthrixaceae bacterium]|nr:hypothetical protein [Microthrixaceae bacterium]